MKTKMIVVAVLVLSLVEAMSQIVPKDMVLIPAGSFQMGDAFNEGNINERPVHTVYTSAFYVEKYEVTKALWDEVYNWAVVNCYTFDNQGSWYSGANHSKGQNHPVHSVNWYDAVKWCNARSEREGRVPAYYTNMNQTIVYRSSRVNIRSDWVKWNSGYRLPTEAEWEKAVRGGLYGKRFSWGDTITQNQANYGIHPQYAVGAYPYTSPVGSFPPNGYGLYDMEGNVGEWCWDYYGKYSSNSLINPRGDFSDSIVAIPRGGSWSSDMSSLRCASRVTGAVLRQYYGRSGGFRSVLPSTSPDSVEVIQIQPAEPVYTMPFEKEKGKDNLILITHGWNVFITRNFPLPDASWVEEMSNVINTYLDTHNLTTWQVYGHKWLDKSWTFYPTDALNNAKQEGKVLGDYIASQGWTHVHLIAHSAGSALIQAISERIKALPSNTTVHCTFLDPYVGKKYEEVSNYGNGADWADQYFSRDSLTRFGSVLTGPFTESLLNKAHNVDVTSLDPNKHIGAKFRSSVTGEMEPCVKTFTHHDWSVNFYVNTITGNGVTTDYKGFGFLLSKEGGNWDYALANHTPNNDPARLLGTPDPICLTEVQLKPLPWVDTLIDFTKSPAVKSDTGMIQKWFDSLKLSSGSPAWVATVVSSTNPVNVVSFDAQFLSATGAQGLLTVLWDDQVIGSIDERAVSINRHTFGFPNAQRNSEHILGFRLDPFTNIQSIVTVTNIVLNQVGVSQPFSLSFAGMTNGVNVYELTGEAGFEYHILASTNLLDWSDIAVLQNTNGAVRFFDSGATNLPTKFYRAVAPY